MNGLPKSKDTTRPKDAFYLVMVLGVERMTQALMKGDAVSPSGLQDMQALERRLGAFSRALNARVEQAENVK